MANKGPKHFRDFTGELIVEGLRIIADEQTPSLSRDKAVVTSFSHAKLGRIEYTRYGELSALMEQVEAALDCTARQARREAVYAILAEYDVLIDAIDENSSVVNVKLN